MVWPKCSRLHERRAKRGALMTHILPTQLSFLPMPIELRRAGRATMGAMRTRGRVLRARGRAARGIGRTDAPGMMWLCRQHNTAAACCTLVVRHRGVWDWIANEHAVRTTTVYV
jgi:hypothetical protein